MRIFFVGLAMGAALFTGVAHAASYTVSASFYGSDAEVNETIKVENFNDMGGTRKLTNVFYYILPTFYASISASVPANPTGEYGAIGFVDFILDSPTLALHGQSIGAADFLNYGSSNWRPFERYGAGLLADVWIYDNITTDLVAFSALPFVELSLRTESRIDCFGDDCTLEYLNTSYSVDLDVTYTYEDVSAVPLPAGLPLLLASLGGMAFLGRRKILLRDL